MAAKNWSEKEKLILRKHYSNCTLPTLMEMLPGRTAASIYRQASKMCMSRFRDNTHILTGRHHYTAEEVTFLKKKGRSMSVEELAESMDGVTASSVRDKLSSLGITRGLRKRWTPEEDLIILQNLDAKTPELQDLGLKHRSQMALRERKRYLKECLREGTKPSYVHGIKVGPVSE